MNKELKKMFEDHEPAPIFPYGLEPYFENGVPMARTIAEGFEVSDSVVFFDVGWNAPMASNNTMHFVKGEVSGPFPEDKKLYGNSRFWKVGDAFIFVIVHPPKKACIP